MILELLNKYKIENCIDSCTLLGLIREGKLLDHDLDIDIAVHQKDVNKLTVLREDLLSKGYKCRILSYHGKFYKYKFWHSNEKRVIDINIFRILKDQDFYICPQPFPIIKKEGIVFTYFRKFIRVVFGYIKNRGPEFDLNKFPWNIATYHRAWLIPKKYFESFSCKDSIVFYPKFSKEYLRFRYGKWEVPNKNWNFRTEDKGLTKNTPDDYNW